MLIEELERLARAATPGPWTLQRHTVGLNGEYGPHDDWTIKGASGNTICYEGNHRDGPLVGDPEYIAAMSPATTLKLLAIWKAANKIASLKPYDRNANNSTAGKWITLNVPGATWAELNAALDDLTPPLRVNGGVR